ncbi:MAG: hypothetical protein ACRD3M_15690 [Thermoanaerobaculia bacterium]
MPRLRAVVLALLLAAPPARAADCRECLDLAAKQDQDITSPSGVRVTVTGRNHCPEDLDGYRCRFKVRVLGAGNTVIATQSGSFGGTIAVHATVETKVFVICDPDRVRSIAVEAAE